jgi:hypothetical protein
MMPCSLRFWCAVQKNRAKDTLQVEHLPSGAVRGRRWLARWSSTAIARCRGFAMLAIQGSSAAAASSCSQVALAKQRTSSSGSGSTAAVAAAAARGTVPVGDAGVGGSWAVAICEMDGVSEDRPKVAGAGRGGCLASAEHSAGLLAGHRGGATAGTLAAVSCAPAATALVPAPVAVPGAARGCCWCCRCCCRCCLRCFCWSAAAGGAVPVGDACVWNSWAMAMGEEGAAGKALPVEVARAGCGGCAVSAELSPGILAGQRGGAAAGTLPAVSCAVAAAASTALAPAPAAVSVPACCCCCSCCCCCCRSFCCRSCCCCCSSSWRCCWGAATCVALLATSTGALADNGRPLVRCCRRLGWKACGMEEGQALVAAAVPVCGPCHADGRGFPKNCCRTLG